MTSNDEVVRVWQEYLVGVSDWEQLVSGIEPKEGGCGLVYAVANPIDRPNESFAFADMQAGRLPISEPHYHVNGETEIYFIVKGSGEIIVGHQETKVSPGSIVIIPPETAHYSVPYGQLVIALVNTPPFRPENYISLDAATTNKAVCFDAAQYERLTPPAA